MISKIKQKKIARERITVLFDEAKSVFKKSPSLANRYVTLARKMAMKYRIKMPREYKRLYCKHCYKFFQPGKTLTTRIKNKTLIYHCKNCGKIIRYPFRST